MDQNKVRDQYARSERRTAKTVRQCDGVIVSERVMGRVRSPRKAKVLRSVGQRPTPAHSQSFPACTRLVAKARPIVNCLVNRDG